MSGAQPPDRPDLSIGRKKQKQVGRIVDAARRLAEQGEDQRAVETAVKALENDPGCLPAYLLVAQVQLRHRNHEPALWAIGEALKLEPDSAAHWFQSARTRRSAGDLAGALADGERALSLDPDLADASGFVVHVLTMLGRDDEACERLAALLLHRPDDVAVGLAFGDLAARMGREREAVERLERHLEALSPGAVARRDVLFRLGRLHERLGDYDRAFAAVREARRSMRLRWDADAYDRAVTELCASWSTQFLARAPRAANDSGRMLFIVGMPRSGTSLVEQILASHPAVAGGGELPHLQALAAEAALPRQDPIPFQRDVGTLTAAVVDRIGAGYLSATSALAGNRPRLTDKMPANHALLGLVELALPAARVVHCRRDARDVSLSCYFTELWEGLRFTGDLAHIGRYARAEQTLMNHWKATLSLPIETVDYEELIGDTERVARRLVGFAGLDWHPGCLQFHQSKRFVDTASAMQVREPIYRSSLGRWRRYEKHLGPLIDALGDPAMRPGDACATVPPR